MFEYNYEIQKLLLSTFSGGRMLLILFGLTIVRLMSRTSGEMIDFYKCVFPDKKHFTGLATIHNKILALITFVVWLSPIIKALIEITPLSDYDANFLIFNTRDINLGLFMHMFFGYGMMIAVIYFANFLISSSTRFSQLGARAEIIRDENNNPMFEYKPYHDLLTVPVCGLMAAAVVVFSTFYGLVETIMFFLELPLTLAIKLLMLLYGIIEYVFI